MSIIYSKSMASNVPFRIDRAHCEIDGGGHISRGYSYKFIFDGDRPVGKVEVLFHPIRLYDQWDTTISDRYRELGLKPDQIVAHLNRFYPNGEGLPNDSELMGQGVGTEALEIIVADAREQGASGMHVSSTRPDMIRFMEKHFKIFFPKPREDGTYPYKFRIASKLI